VLVELVVVGDRSGIVVRGRFRAAVFVLSLMGERVRVAVPEGIPNPWIRYRDSDGFVNMEYGNLQPYNQAHNLRLGGKRPDGFGFWGYRGCSVANPFM
jgi:hypothetical protein